MTKLLSPSIFRDIVTRPRFDTARSSRSKLTVISGPAGSGKTTLMSQLCAAQDHSCWLSLDESDNDSAVFWSAIISSIAMVRPGFGEAYRYRLDSIGPDGVAGVVAEVVNELVTDGSSLHIFLDDIHTISNPQCLQSLHQFIDLLVPPFRVTLAGRGEPVLPLGKYRLSGELTEIRGQDLRMDLEETSDLFKSLGLEADAETLNLLHDHVEGWVAGLRWVGVALAQDPAAGDLIDAFAAAERGLRNYIVEEVLDRLAPEERRFLLETSILAQFTSELCDEVSGGANDSSSLIHRLKLSNAFVIELDRPGEWHRYHHLVSEVAENLLKRELPSVLPGLHRRAAHWYRRNGHVGQAVRHSLAAGDALAAAEDFCGSWWAMVNTGRIETALGLFDLFSATQIRSYQPLAIAGAFVYGLAGDQQQGRNLARVAEQGSFDGRPPDGCATIESSLALMRGGLSVDGINSALADGQRAYELEPVESQWRPVAAMIVAACQIAGGNSEAAAPYLDETISGGDDSTALLIYALAEKSLYCLGTGDLDGAQHHSVEAVRLAQEGGIETMFVLAKVRAASAHYHLAVGDTVAAHADLLAAAKPMEADELAMPVDFLRAGLLLADVAVQLGAIDTAESYLASAHRIARGSQDLGVLPQQIAHLKTRLENASRNCTIGLTDREVEVLEQLATNLTVREIAEELYLSRNTVKSYVRRLYHKLDVSSRPAAVMVARQSGLLPEG